MFNQRIRAEADHQDYRGIEQGPGNPDYAHVDKLPPGQTETQGRFVIGVPDRRLPIKQQCKHEA